MNTESNLPKHYPIINNNGDSPRALMANYRALYKAIEVVEEALRNATPHGRNYQIGGTDYQAARDLHEQHLIELRNMRIAYVNLWDHVEKSA